jgi:uncharacterized protein (UPF0333 family)
MSSRNLLIAVVLLAALSGGVWYAKKHPDSGTTVSTTTTPKVADIPSDQVERIALKKKDAPEIVLQKQGGKWQIEQPEKLAADQTSVSSLTSALSPLNADSVVDENGGDASKFGLSSPSMTVTVTRKGGASDTITFGDDSPAGSLVYVKNSGSSKIYAVSNSAKTSFDKSLNDLRDKRLLTFDNNKLTSVELTSKKAEVTFAKNNQGDWQIIKPTPSRADSFQVDDLIRKLQDAKMDLSGSADDQKKAAAAFAGGQPLGSVKLTDSSGAQSLEIRKNKDDYFAKSSAVAGVFKVASDLGTAVDKGIDDFRNKKLFDFGFSDPTKIEFQNGATSSVYQKSGSDWKLNGKTLDAATTQAVIDQLRDLSASGFPATGFANPTLGVAVVSNDGKRTEHVSFAKSGTKYIAKRDDGPALYEVPEKNVDDLVKAFGQIKPAVAKKLRPPKAAA